MRSMTLADYKKAFKLDQNRPTPKAKGGNTLARHIEKIRWRLLQAYSYLREETAVAVGLSADLDYAAFVHWAQHKKYKYNYFSNDTSYFYIGLVLGCIDADLCK